MIVYLFIYLDHKAMQTSINQKLLNVMNVESLRLMSILKPCDVATNQGESYTLVEKQLQGPKKASNWIPSGKRGGLTYRYLRLNHIYIRVVSTSPIVERE